MEIEKGGSLLFLDILVSIKQIGKLGCGVYQKPTYTYLYLHAKSSVLRTLVYRAWMVTDQANFLAETDYLNMLQSHRIFRKRDPQSV